MSLVRAGCTASRAASYQLCCFPQKPNSPKTICSLQVGVGRFQWTALAVCGLANASDAVEILALSLVLPAAEDDLHLTAAGKSALSSCIFIGERFMLCFTKSPLIKGHDSVLQTKYKLPAAEDDIFFYRSG
jgi:hypothetical protein